MHKQKKQTGMSNGLAPLMRDVSSILELRFRDYPNLAETSYVLSLDARKHGMEVLKRAFPDFQFHQMDAQDVLRITQIPFPIIDSLYTGPTWITNDEILELYQEYNTIKMADDTLESKDICRYLGLTANGLFTLALMGLIARDLNIKIILNINAPTRRRISTYKYNISWHEFEPAVGVFTVSLADKYSTAQMREALEELIHLGGHIDHELQKIIFTACPVNLIGTEGETYD